MKTKIYAMIPVRFGSERLRLKNLALINKKPLIYYALKAAKDCNIFDKIFVNSDHEIFEKIAKRYKVNFYLRPKRLGKSITKSDDVVADFIKKHPEAEILVWVNSISPFQESKEIRRVIKYFIRKKLDSLITTENKKIHGNYLDKPINYTLKNKFALTQSLKPIQLFVYSLMMWRTQSFISCYKKKKYAIINGKFDTYPISKKSSLIIKNKEDLKFANIFARHLSLKSKFRVNYDKIYKKNRNIFF